MSTLSSASTNAQVEAAYDDNASYAEDASVTKAKAFITACRIILRRKSGRSGKSGAFVEFDRNLIRQELQAAQAYVSANDTTAGAGGAGVKILSVRDFSR